MGQTASQHVADVRRIVADRDQRLWSDAEILLASHSAYSSLWGDIVAVERDEELDRVEFSSSEFTQLDSSTWELRLPEFVGKVRMLTRAGSLRSRSAILTNWRFSAGAFPGKVTIDGSIPSVVVVWFIRRHPQLHTGFARATVAGGGSLTFDATTARVGRLVTDEGFYVGMQVEIVADTTTPANVGKRGFITAFDGVAATIIPAFGAITSGVTKYELVTPMPPEGDTYFAWKTSEELLSRSFDHGTLAQVQQRIYGPRGLKEEFDAFLTRRVPQARILLRRNQT